MVRQSKLGFWGIVLLGIVMFAACGGKAAEGDCLAAEGGELVPVPCGEVDGVPPTPTPTPSGQDTPGVTPPVSPPPPEGQALFLRGAAPVACAVCHAIDGVAGAAGQIGPNLTNIGARGESHIRESIVAPNAVIAEICPTGPCAPNVMIQTYGTTLSEEELDALVAFLLTLR